MSVVEACCCLDGSDGSGDGSDGEGPPTWIAACRLDCEEEPPYVNPFLNCAMPQVYRMSTVAGTTSGEGCCNSPDPMDYDFTAYLVHGVCLGEDVDGRGFGFGYASVNIATCPDPTIYCGTPPAPPYAAGCPGDDRWSMYPICVTTPLTDQVEGCGDPPEIHEFTFTESVMMLQLRIQDVIPSHFVQYICPLSTWSCTGSNTFTRILATCFTDCYDLPPTITITPIATPPCVQEVIHLCGYPTS